MAFVSCVHIFLGNCRSKDKILMGNLQGHIEYLVGALKFASWLNSSSVRSFWKLPSVAIFQNSRILYKHTRCENVNLDAFFLKGSDGSYSGPKVASGWRKPFLEGIPCPLVVSPPWTLLGIWLRASQSESLGCELTWQYWNVNPTLHSH